MGKLIVIIISIGLIAGVSSLILDGAPNIHPSPTFVFILIIILSLVIILIIAILRAMTATTRNNNEWGGGGNGGVDLPPLPINPYGHRQPKLPRHSKQKYLTDDDIIQGEVIDEKLLTISHDYDFKKLPAKTRVRK